MNKLLCGLLLSLFVAVCAYAQTVLQETKKKTPRPSDIDGSWIGGVGGSSRLRFVLHIITYEDGMTATHDSPDQNGFGLPVTTITRDGSKLKFEIKPIRGGFEGNINPELTTISGTWEQLGRSIPLVLKRASEVPRPGNTYTKKEELVSMRDGARLATDLYFPSSPSNNLPVVLDRTPYNKAIFGPEAKFWTSRGYVYAVQDVRGRFRSEGQFEAGLREGPDGYDTIEWLARQPWCSGKVGTIGTSYDAMVQWQTAVERPPHLAAMVVNCSPSDRVPYEQGVLELMPEMQWLYIIRSQKPEDRSPLTAIESLPPPAFEKRLDELPVAEQDLKVFGHVDELWRKWCHEGPDSDYWNSARYQSKLDRVTVPVLHQSGWFDGNGLGTMRNYLALMKLGAKNQRLILGPWGHTPTSTREERGRDFGEAALLDLEQEYADWFAHWLKGEAAPAGNPVKLFVMGENRWMTAASYPPPGQPKKYFLGSDFALLPDRGDGRSGRDQYVYDPGDPTPAPYMLGDEMESRYGEMLKERKDILTYRSAPIQEPFKILGPMSAVIHVSSDVPETDIVVRISEEDPSHNHFLLAEGISRVRFNGKKPARVEVELWHTAIRIAKGNRLVVDIASASFPMFARNLNTGENSLTGTVHRKAKVTLHRSAEFPSFIEFSSVNSASTAAALSTTASPTKQTDQKAPQSMPTVDQILDKYVQAIGGAAAHRKLTSQVMKMTLVIRGADVTGSFESYRQAPNKAVEIGQVKLPDSGELEFSRGFNGAEGWDLNPADGGFRELSGTGLAAEKRNSEFNWEIKLKELYPKMALLGEAQPWGHTAYCIEATPTEGDPIKLYFDSQTGLLVRLDSIDESADKTKTPVETYFEDYREVDGVKIPFTVRQPVYKLTFKVNEVRHNVPIEEAKFKSPGAALDELSISRASKPGPPSTRSGVLYLSLQSSGNQLSIRADLDGKNKSFTVAKGAEEIVSRLKMIFERIDNGKATKADLTPALKEYGALIFAPIADMVESAPEIQFVIPGRFLTLPLDLLHFKGRPLFLQKPVTYSFEKIGSGQFSLSPQRTALIISDPSTDPENGCQVLKDILPSSGYYKMEDMNLARLSSLQAADILLISAHGGVQIANTDYMKMGNERLRPEHLSHLSPSMVYFDSCNLGVSAHFIQSFRDRGTMFYVAPILSNEAGDSSTKTIAFFFERLKSGDTPSKALFYTRKKLFEIYGEKEGFNKLLFRAFPFRVYSLN